MKQWKVFKHKVFKREYIIQISKVAKTSHSHLIQAYHVILKRISLILRWNSELLLAKILKSSRKTTWLQKSIWSLTAVVLAFNFFPVNGEMPECSPTLSDVQMLACFAIIGRITSTTREFVNYIIV